MQARRNPVSPQPPPLSLDDLLARAEDLALFSMRARGKVLPTLLAVGPGGPLFFVPASLKDERAKDQFANLARLICIAHAATAAVMILEAWMKLASADGKLDLTVPPSESMDRKEVVVLTGESRTGCRQKMLPLIRTGAGGFFGFGEFEGPEPTSFNSTSIDFFTPWNVRSPEPFQDSPLFFRFVLLKVISPNSLTLKKSGLFTWSSRLELLVSTLLASTVTSMLPVSPVANEPLTLLKRP